MASLTAIRSKLYSLTPSELENFRRRLEHGQPNWTPEQYAALIAERPAELQPRAAYYLGLAFEEDEPRNPSGWGHRLATVFKLATAVVAFLAALRGFLGF